MKSQLLTGLLVVCATGSLMAMEKPPAIYLFDNNKEMIGYAFPGIELPVRLEKPHNWLGKLNSDDKKTLEQAFDCAKLEKKSIVVSYTSQGTNYEGTITPYEENSTFLLKVKAQ